MTDEERFFYELGRKAYYGGMEYSIIKAVENMTNTNTKTLDELLRGEWETPGKSNKKEGD